MTVAEVNTRVGTLLLGEYEKKIVMCAWKDAVITPRILKRFERFCPADGSENRATEPLQEAATQIMEYIDGTRKEFSFEFALYSSDFARRVLMAVSGVKRGETASYGEIARIIGKPRATQAVAGAIAANPLNLIIPCHRIIPADGSLGNYAGTPAVKAELLRLEGFTVYNQGRFRTEIENQVKNT